MFGELIVLHALAYAYALKHFPETTAMVVAYLPSVAIGTAVAVGWLIGDRLRATKVRRATAAQREGGAS